MALGNLIPNTIYTSIPAPDWAARQEDTAFGNRYGRAELWPTSLAIPVGTLTAAQKTAILASLDDFWYKMFPYELEEVDGGNGKTWVRIKTQHMDYGYPLDTRPGAPAQDPIRVQLAAEVVGSRNHRYGGYSAWFIDWDRLEQEDIEQFANLYWQMRKIILAG